ncbi:MAG: hypothetical protein Q4F21_08560 [Lachnospiraceae bacterium]|nr:hypothetical protein [Lachnospiraceae bacterium]
MIDEFKKGDCFFADEKSRFLIVGDAINKADGRKVYLCQELTESYRLMIWSAEDISKAGNYEKCAASAAANTASADVCVASADLRAASSGSCTASADICAASGDICETEDETPQKLMLRFLEAHSCSEKLEILGMMKGKVTESMLESLAISMDYEVGSGSVEEMYYGLERFLKTRKRYEGTRLR